jgi:hypothetical protein
MCHFVNLFREQPICSPCVNLCSMPLHRPHSGRQLPHLLLAGKGCSVRFIGCEWKNRQGAWIFTCFVMCSSRSSSTPLSNNKLLYCNTKRFIGEFLGTYVFSMWFALSTRCVDIILAQNLSFENGFAHFSRHSYIRVMNGWSLRSYLTTIASHADSNSSGVSIAFTNLRNWYLNSEFFLYTGPNDSGAFRRTCHLHQRCRVSGMTLNNAVPMAAH